MSRRGYVSPFSISRLNCAHRWASRRGGTSEEDRKGTRVADVMRSRSVTSRGVMLAGNDAGCEAGCGEGDMERDSEAEGDPWPRTSGCES